MTEPIRPSVWCRAMWKTGLSVSAVRIAREEYQGCPSRDRKRLSPPAFDNFVGEPDREAAALAQAGVIRAPLRDLVVLLGNVAAAVLVQLRGKMGIQGSEEEQTSYIAPSCDTTGRSHAAGHPAKLPYQATHGTLMRWAEVPNDAQQGSRLSDFVVSNDSSRNPC